MSKKSKVCKRESEEGESRGIMTVNELRNRHYEIIGQAQDIQSACIRAFRQLDALAENPSEADLFEVVTIQQRLERIKQCADKILLEVSKAKGDKT